MAATTRQSEREMLAQAASILFKIAEEARIAGDELSAIGLRHAQSGEIDECEYAELMQTSRLVERVKTLSANVERLLHQALEPARDRTRAEQERLLAERDTLDAQIVARRALLSSLPPDADV